MCNKLKGDGDRASPLISHIALKIHLLGSPGRLSSAAFSPGPDPGDLWLSPTSGSLQGEPASPSACVSASLFLLWINKILKKEIHLLWWIFEYPLSTCELVFAFSKFLIDLQRNCVYSTFTTIFQEMSSNLGLKLEFGRKKNHTRSKLLMIS